MSICTYTLRAWSAIRKECTRFVVRRPAFQDFRMDIEETNPLAENALTQMTASSSRRLTPRPPPHQFAGGDYSINAPECGRHPLTDPRRGDRAGVDLRTTAPNA